MNSDSPANPLTWLHLSDLHIGGEDWQRDTVLKGLVRDLPRLLKERRLTPDLVFVTGDVANRGQRKEYDGAFILLERITELLGLVREQHVFLVPGNHDVDRSRVGRIVKRDHESLLEQEPDDLRKEIAARQRDPREFTIYGERFTEWCAFTDKFLGRARSVSLDKPWRADVVSVRGLQVGVLSLCTAWASSTDKERGRLFLGEGQLHDLLAEANDGGAQLTIALMHHPLHWLHDGEYSAIRGRLEREVDLVLHGHAHDAHSAVQVTAGSAHAVLGAGAAYAGLGQDRYHGFSAGILDTDAGQITIHHFTWTTQSAKWHPHSGAPGADNEGRVILPTRPVGFSLREQRGGHEVLAGRLRNAAARVYATIDFGGLGAEVPRKHVTLEQIFVPLHLRRAGLQTERINLHGLEARLSSKSTTRVVVLGDPGGGKSTLAKYLASTLAQRENDIVPLLLTVRDWIAEGKREGLLEMAARQATDVLSVRTNAEALDDLCEQGKVVLIVDGIDEAADPETRAALRDRVHGFSTSKVRTPVLVTSRIAGYHEVPLDDAFDQFILESFDDSAIEEFVNRWYNVVESNPAERIRKRVDLLHALDAEPRAKALARNPLLATLIGMVHFSHAHLPGDRAKLYGMMIELLLVTWPKTRNRELAGLHGTAQQPMLEALALRLQDRRARRRTSEQSTEVLLGVVDLEAMLAALLEERFPELSQHERRHLARRWGKWLVNDSGLLQEQQPGKIGFLHLSLMEYMAGSALLRQGLSGGYGAVAKLVVDYCNNAAWRNTLLLMLGSENKNRDLGETVVEHLLASRQSRRSSQWETCVFGLALLREDIDMGSLREPLFQYILEVALDYGPQEWKEISRFLTDVVRFSRTHGSAAKNWILRELESASEGRLVVVLHLAEDVLPWDAIESKLRTRINTDAATSTMLDLGPEQRIGAWTRARATRNSWLSWARATPLVGTMARSLESLLKECDPKIWILPLFVRADYIAVTLADSARRLSTSPRHDGGSGLPSMVTWNVAEECSMAVRLDPSLSNSRQAKWPSVSLRGPSRHSVRAAAVSFADDFVARWTERGISVRERELMQTFARSFLLEFAIDLDITLATGFSQLKCRDVARVFERHFALDLARTFTSHFDRDIVDSLEVTVGRPIQHQKNHGSSWNRFRRARTTNSAFDAIVELFVIMIAETHLALVAGSVTRDLESVEVLTALRLQNRWMNLFFAHLTGCNTNRHNQPELHAILLTYGLVQYQTTWEWPDCPHWRSWLTGDPPAHWLPAHVFHLIRSIQDPTDPTHRLQATAALDRNDWPELAQALRETTLVPTPPEVLALFDRGIEHPSS